MTFAQIPSISMPQFEAEKHNFWKNPNQFNWQLLNDINPDFIRQKQDTEIMDQLIYSFVDSEFGAVERQFLPFPLSAKFFYTFQVCINYLLNKQQKTERKLKESQKYAEKLEHKLENVYVQMDEIAQKSPPSEIKIVHSCPICLKAYKSLAYLDKHIQNFHTNQTELWAALRSGKSYEIHQELEEMRNNLKDIQANIIRQNFTSNMHQVVPTNCSRQKPNSILKKPKEVSSSHSHHSNIYSSCVAPIGSQYDMVDESFSDSYDIKCTIPEIQRDYAWVTSSKS